MYDLKIGHNMKPVKGAISLCLTTWSPYSKLTGQHGPRQHRKSYIAEEFGAEEIQLNCTEQKALVAGTSSSNKLVSLYRYQSP